MTHLILGTAFALILGIFSITAHARDDGGFNKTDISGRTPAALEDPVNGVRDIAQLPSPDMVAGIEPAAGVEDGSISIEGTAADTTAAAKIVKPEKDLFDDLPLAHKK